MEDTRREKPGQPTTFDQAVVDRICATISETGCSVRAAAELEGEDESTIRHWRAANKEFCRALRKAKGAQKVEVARDLRSSARDGDTTARIFRGKCIDPDTWTERKERTEDTERKAKLERERIAALMASVGGPRGPSATDSA